MSAGESAAELQVRLQELQARLTGILDAAIDGMIVIDQRGIVEIFNAAAEQIFGYRAGEVIGRNVSMLMPSPYREEHDRYLDNYLRTGVRRIIGIGREATGLRADGTRFPIELAVGTVTVMGKPLFIGTVRDISRQKATEQALQEHRNRLAHVGRVTTMGEMASGIAHEINQPLTAVATYAQVCRRLLNAPQPDRDAIGNLLEQITHQAMRAGEVIKRLRGFIQPLAFRVQDFDINRTVRATLELACIDSTHGGIAIVSALAADLPPAHGDVVQIEQVLLNLLRNAMDALAEAGTPAPEIQLSTRLNEAGDVEVEVADNGPGVDPAAAGELFTPFFTTKEQGTGLGLSISHTIITAHNGRLQFAPRPGGGARFWFSLPAATTDHG